VQHDRKDPLAVTATAARARQIAGQLRLNEDAFARALALSGAVPDRVAFAQATSRFLMLAGTALIVAGVAAFFAFNWAELHRLAKFALIEGGIVAAVFLAWRQGLDRLAGQAALFGAGFLTGVLLAIYGQAYQTGADPYGLFLGWAALILGWAVIGQQAGLWLLLAVLVNLTLALYWGQVLHPPAAWVEDLAHAFGPASWIGYLLSDFRLAQLVFGLNGVLLIAWEFGTRRGVAWMRGRGFPRLIALFALAAIADAALLLIFTSEFRGADRLHVVAPVLFAAFVAAALWYYRVVERDLFILAASLLAVIVVATAFAARFLPGDFDAFLALSVLVVAQTAGAAAWLRRVARSWRMAS
jgi:uncharacterized membrane protein